MRPAHLLSSVAGMLVVLYLGIAAVAASVLTVPRREMPTGNPHIVTGLNYEDVSFPARTDGVTIDGWYIPARGSQRAVIFVHGKDGCRSCEFQGKALQFVAGLQRRGFAVLMIDLRGHGRSGDGRFTFGRHERYDIEGAVDWLRREGFAPGHIGLIGVSMGAASSVGAAAEEPAIGALVIDSAYAEIYPVLEQEFPQASGLPAIFLPATVLMGRLFVGDDIARARPIDEIGRIAPRPVLVIHAAGDGLIPVAHARTLAATAGVSPWIINGDSHTLTYTTAPREYLERVALFFDEHLGH